MERTVRHIESGFTRGSARAGESSGRRSSPRGTSAAPAETGLSAQRWLSRASLLDAEIGALQEARDAALARCVASSSGGGERVSGGGGDRRCGAMEAYARLGEALNSRIDALCDIKARTVETVTRVEDSRLRALLIHRYVNLRTWEQTAELLEVEPRHVYRLHKAAIRAFEAVFDADEAAERK